MFNHHGNVELIHRCASCEDINYSRVALRQQIEVQLCHVQNCFASPSILIVYLLPSDKGNERVVFSSVHLLLQWIHLLQTCLQ